MSAHEEAAQRTMTQMGASSSKIQKGGPAPGSGLRQASKDSNKQSHRSHRSRASQTQYTAGYASGQGNHPQQMGEATMNMGQKVDGKQRNQA